MSKVFVLTTGEYSDYRIVGVFSTLEKAELESEAWHRANPIESYELDKTTDRPLGCTPFRVSMNHEGKVVAFSIDPDKCCDRDGRPAPTGGYKIPEKWDAQPTTRNFLLWAKDETEAIKIVNERRIMMLASGEWFK